MSEPTNHTESAASPSPAGGRVSPPPPRRKRSPVLFLVLGALLLLFSGLVLAVVLGLLGLGTMAGGAGNTGYRQVEVVPGKATKKIMIVSVSGIIHSGQTGPFSVGTSADRLQQQLRWIARDDNVAAVILELNTPGGEVTASDEIHRAIQRLRRERNLPVIACMRSVAASGGYYLAAGTDHIVANRMTLTGSIGVIIGGYNYHDLLNKVGLEQKLYHRGELKDLGNPARDPDSDSPAVQRRNRKDAEILQGLVDDTYEEFVEVVAKGRGLAPDVVRAPPIGDSRVLSGEQALELELVDELGYMSDAIAEARKRTGDYRVMRYEPIPSLLRTLSAKSERPALVDGLLPEEHRLIKRGRMYFLNPSMF